MKLQATDLSVDIERRTVVRNVSLALQAGELIGLIGPNGAGKSTLLRALVGVQKPTTGAIMLNERPVQALSARDRARAIAYLPQEHWIQWRLTARDVVLLGRYPYSRAFGAPESSCIAAVDWALTMVDAQALANRAVSALSGGERARILLARALAVQAPILLADEPIAQLDPYQQLHVMEILRAVVARGAGVLLVLHDLALASRFMDRLILMHHGRIVTSGAPREVLRAENLADVYQIKALALDTESARAIVPWQRL